MNRRYLILDCNYLAHRAKHVFGDLSDKGSATGVIYGFLKDILFLRERFDTNRFVFCWDSKTSKRKAIFPEYKEHRESPKRTKKEVEFEEEFRRQVRMLRTKYLPTIGFKNIFQEKGYESDDLIAVVCQAIVPDLEEGIIVTADADLYQCIRKNIRWYNPRKKLLMSRRKFIKTFGIKPKDWVKVKAIAGCQSDNVPGIRGVGNLTAISYLEGRLAKHTKAYADIKSGWKNIVLRNRPLVQLPFAGIKPITQFEKDEITQEGWNKVTKKLGMKSIRYKSVT